MTTTTSTATGHSAHAPSTLPELSERVSLSERVKYIAYCARLHNLTTVHGLPASVARRRARRFAIRAAAKVTTKRAAPARDIAA